jgi:histidinol-phosphatase (PHP family)
MSEPIMYETHSHTPLCKHAFGDPIDYAAVAAQRGLRGLVVTCHNPMPNGFSANVRMQIGEFMEYLNLVDRARRHWVGQVDVQLGLEADYFPGYESWLAGQLRTPLFQYVIGSVHPQIREFRETFWQNDPIAFQRIYFELLADAAESGLFDCLAHPDLVKNETADSWNPLVIIGDIRCSLDRIAATGVAMELNTSGAHKVIPEMNPFPEMLVEMQQREIPVVVGADAHRPERVGEGFDEALQLLRGCGYTHTSFFLERTRIDVPIDEALASLQPLDAGERSDDGQTSVGSKQQISASADDADAVSA